MTDIFISYAHEDGMRVREIVRALEEQRWSIFWDRRIPAGKTWHGYIGKALSDARCVIVAWSHHSITSEWVIEEANRAKGRGVLVPVLLDSVQPPLGFSDIQAADLTEWKPGYSSPPFDQLIQDIAGVLGTKPPHEPAPRKHEPPETRPQEPEPIQPIPPEPGKKRPNFLIGAVIALALAIVVGLVLRFARESPRLPETRPSESQVPQALEVRPQAQEVSKPAAKSPEPQAKPATEAPTTLTFRNSIDMSFVLIPAGTFKMGSPGGEPGRDSEEQQHPVTISKPFYLQTTEVTQKQWREVMGSNPSAFEGCDDCPVEQVSWDDAQEFIRKLNKKESGKRYRLPTEAEWEYACRAGSITRFCFGDDEERLGDYAWYYKNSGSRTHPVGQKKPNAWGLYDMHGNVAEWCQDWYGAYPKSRITDPRGPKSGEYRVVRGNHWNHEAGYIRSATRNWFTPDFHDYIVGFRLARDS